MGCAGVGGQSMGCQTNPSRLKFGQKLPQAARRAMEAREAEVIAHESAHANALGALGGGISYVRNAHGYIVAGSVPVSFQGLNKANPSASMAAAQTIMAGARAPASPSMQDMAVYAKAYQQYQQAESLLKQKQQAPDSGFNILA